MFENETLNLLTDGFLFLSCLFILFGSIVISFKTRFIQIKLIPFLLKNMRKEEKQVEGAHTISPQRALFTAMSTTLGMGTIVAPIIAIYYGGPGALIGFLLTSFFGSAATYSEVSLSIQHRKKLESGVIMGGPMQYLKKLLSPAIAKFYAVGCFLLMVSWSGAQSNQLAAILNSHMLGAYSIPKEITGLVLAIITFIVLIGGIKWIGAISAKLVPMMFVLYLGSCFWIFFSNISILPSIFGEIIQSAMHPQALASGAIVGGIFSALRWGVFKGLHVSEAGIGTQTIPHSMAETSDPSSQGMLAMASTYMSGFLALLSGCVALITKTWQDPQIPLGINMVAASFEMYFPSFGLGIVALATLLFAFGTILGNSYNGSQCFGYLTNNRGLFIYFGLTSFVVFLGAVADVQIMWAYTDLILAAITIPHMAALVKAAFKSVPKEQDTLVPLTD